MTRRQRAGSFPSSFIQPVGQPQTTASGDQRRASSTVHRLIRSSSRPQRLSAPGPPSPNIAYRTSAPAAAYQFATAWCRRDIPDGQRSVRARTTIFGRRAVAFGRESPETVLSGILTAFAASSGRLPLISAETPLEAPVAPSSRFKAAKKRSSRTASCGSSRNDGIGRQREATSARKSRLRSGSRRSGAGSPVSSPIRPSVTTSLSEAQPRPS